MKQDTAVALGLVVAVVVVGVVGCPETRSTLTGSQVDVFLDVQQTIADEQAALGQGRDALEADRRLWASRQRSDPIIAMSIQSAAILIACCLPMVLVAFLLWRGGEAASDTDVTETMLIELLNQEPKRLLQPESSAIPKLPEPKR